MDGPKKLRRTRAIPRAPSEGSGLEDLSLRAVRQEIDGAFGPLSDVADARLSVREQSLFSYNTVSLDDETNQRLTREARDEEVAFPLRKKVPTIDHEGSGRDDRIPIIDGLLETRRLGGLMDRLARIFLSVADHGPPIVLSALDEIQ